jgi:hypothetical protein
MAIVTPSFVRARRPSERRRTIFVKSSAKPSSAQATVTPKIPIEPQS